MSWDVTRCAGMGALPWFLNLAPRCFGAGGLDSASHGALCQYHRTCPDPEAVKC